MLEDLVYSYIKVHNGFMYLDSPRFSLSVNTPNV